jgi:phosphohistidine phosphatase SixA
MASAQLKKIPDVYGDSISKYSHHFAKDPSIIITPYDIDINNKAVNPELLLYIKSQQKQVENVLNNVANFLGTYPLNYKLQASETKCNPSNLVSNEKYTKFMEWALKRQNLRNTNTIGERKIPTILVVGHNHKMKQLVESVSGCELSYDLTKKCDVTDTSVSEERRPDADMLVFDFSRHGYSCNNLKDKWKNIKTDNILTKARKGLISLSEKDWEPSLTIPGIIGAYNIGKKRAKDAPFNLESNKLVVCVSCLIRTWQTATLLFLHQTTELELRVCPYLKEEENLGGLFVRGNYPIPVEFQLNTFASFLNLLLLFGNKNFSFDTEYKSSFLTSAKTITIYFECSETVEYVKFSINNSEIKSIIKLKLEPETRPFLMKGGLLMKSMPFPNSDKRWMGFSLSEELDKAKGALLKQTQKLSTTQTKETIMDILSLVQKGNCWRTEMFVNTNNIINRCKIYSGIPVVEDTTSACEVLCDFGYKQNFSSKLASCSNVTNKKSGKKSFGGKRTKYKQNVSRRRRLSRRQK